MKTCSKCQKQFKTLTVIDGVQKNLGNRKYCLECSPWGQHNTTRIEKATHKTCRQCQQTFPNTVEFFYPRYDKGKTLSTHCIKCYNQYRVQKFRDMKSKCVAYKGGKCEACGYSKCEAAMDFHHPDPSKKEISIGSGKFFRFEKIKKELDKCILLCSNCHREEHYTLGS